MEPSNTIWELELWELEFWELELWELELWELELWELELCRLELRKPASDNQTLLGIQKPMASPKTCSNLPKRRFKVSARRF